MADGLIPNWRTALLGLATVHIVVVGLAMLVRDPRLRSDGWLGVFLIILAGILLPYVAGYAGAYDRWRWLTFAPVAVPLGLGPSLYIYAHRRYAQRPPPGGTLHLLPPGLQILYFACAFALPLEQKWSWYTGGHRDWVIPAFEVLTAVSLAAYAFAVLKLLTGRSRSSGSSSDRPWVSSLLVGLCILLVARSGYDLVEASIGPLGYEPEFWLYLLFAMAGLFAATEGWRQMGRGRRPRGAATSSPQAQDDPAAVARAYAERILEAGWWLDPDMTTPQLARHLGISETRLSRAFNSGLGMSVARFLSNVRAEAVADALRRGATEDLLQIALASGFASKATFNRAFAARFGCSPSRFRQDVSNSGNRNPEGESRRTDSGTPS